MATKIKTKIVKAGKTRSNYKTYEEDPYAAEDMSGLVDIDELRRLARKHKTPILDTVNLAPDLN